MHQYFKAPLLNEYKKKFVQKRILETLLGGCILKFDYSVPYYVYINQILLYSIPFLFGGIGILIGDVTNSNRITISSIDAAIFVLYLIILKLFMQFVIIYKTNNGDSNKNTKEHSRLEDEEHFYFESYCSIQTIHFTLPSLMLNKTYNSNDILKFTIRLITDCIIAGFIMFCGIYFLSLAYLYRLFGIGVNVVVFIFSWLTICNGLYSLCIRNPPESSVSNSYSQYFNIAYLSRAFYITIFFIIEMLYSFAPDHANIPTVAIMVIKIIFLFLPILWFLGVLPPFDIFLAYITEQAYIFLYGGSATSTLLRLIIQFLLAIVLSLVYFIPNNIAIIALLSAFGYIFASIDFINLYAYTKNVIFKRNTKIGSSDINYLHHSILINEPDITFQNTSNNLPKATRLETLRLIVYYLGMLLLTLLCSMLIINLFINFQINQYNAFQIEVILLYICIGLFVICKLCSLFQSVYIFGIVRNPLYSIHCLNQSYPSNQLILNENKLIFKILMCIRLVLLKFVSPIVLCAVITIDCYINGIYNDPKYGYMRVLFVLRAYRWIWQSTYSCLIEMSIMSHLLLFAILYNIDSTTSDQLEIIKIYLPVCMLASFIHDRLIQFVNKVFAFFLITITSWTLKSQRTKIALVFIIINICILFIPYILPVITTAAIFNAPLLPLFTFPIFIIGFPRTKHFWPQQFISNKEVVSNLDSHFYAQLIPFLLSSFKKCIQYASIDNLRADTYFISRFQDRIIWLQVLETCNSSCIIQIKGLEMQETSCHTVEAHILDDAFELAFNNPNGADSNDDENSNFHFNPYIFSCFLPTDVLLLNAYSDAKTTLIGVLDNSDSFKIIKQYFPKVLHYFLIRYLVQFNRKNDINTPSNKRPNTASSLKSSTKINGPISNEHELQTSVNKSMDTDQQTLERPKSNRQKKQQSDDWGDDNDSLFEELEKIEKQIDISKKEKKNQNTIIKREIPFNQSDTDLFTSHNDNNFFNTLKITENTHEKSTRSFTKIETSSILNIPADWIKLIENYEIQTKQFDEYSDFQKTLETDTWIRRLLEISEIGAGSIDEVCIQYLSLLNSNHFLFLIKCCSFLGLFDNGISSRLNISTIYKLYNGMLPWSNTNSHIKNQDLDELLIKAFRVTVKFAIDCMTISECSSDDEFFETMETYESQWYIGVESDLDYIKYLRDNKPFIFSLFYDQQKKSINSRTLSLQQIKSPLTYLNPEIVKAIWSSTNLELLYMTNDDDERYSIQAHPYILRNLTIQASDPPLGYPIYKSEPLYISFF